MLPVNFRVDEGDLKRAQERIKATGVKLPDLMRLAVKAIADGDATAFNDVLLEGDSSSPDDINSAWLYHKCHELFEYKGGHLIRKGNKGQGVAGGRVDVTVRDGVRHILINGNHYPLKDIVWLMYHGEVAGEVVYKHNGLVSDRIEDLKLRDSKKGLTQISQHVTEPHKNAILRYKLRSLIIDTRNSDRRLKVAIEQLIYREEAFHLILSDPTGWRAVRRALYAQKLSEHTYCVSIS